MAAGCDSIKRGTREVISPTYYTTCIVSTLCDTVSSVINIQIIIIITQIIIIIIIIIIKLLLLLFKLLLLLFTFFVPSVVKIPRVKTLS